MTPGLEGKIVFSSGKSGNFNIFVLDLKSRGLEQLTFKGSNDCPKWSPDGKKIAFVSNQTGTPEIWTMNEDGGEQIRLSKQDRWQSAPAWSPDGKRLAFCANYDGNVNIYTVGSEGQDLKQITCHKERDYSPRFSPDGTKIVYSSKSAGAPQIWQADLNTKEVKQLTTDGNRNFSPCYSPDGKKIAFISGESDPAVEENLDVYIMSADGSTQTRLTFQPGSNRQVGWSPDGKYLIYAYSTLQSAAERIHILESSSGKNEELKFDRRELEEAIEAKPQGAFFFALFPESFRRKFYSQSFFGTDRFPDWKS